MSFSMPSYCLGVGTVVGALALGFGGGIVLTKTAIKDTPAGPSRIERAARVEPAAPVTEAKAIPLPGVEQASAQAAPAPVPSVQAAESTNPVEAIAKETPAEPVRQVDMSRQPEQRQADAKQSEQPVRQSEAKPAEQSDTAARATERAQRRAEQRRIAREKRLAERERKARAAVVVRRQRPVEEQEQPARPQLAFQREESGPGPFEGLFGRPAEADRD